MNRIIAIIFLLLPLLGKSQTLLKGTVKNNAEPVAWANVVLTDSMGKFVTGTTTQMDGIFVITAKSGTYKIKVSMIRYTDWRSTVVLDKDTNLGTIQLKDNAQALGTVVVMGRKNLIEHKPDRLVFNVGSNVATMGGSAVGAIGAAPGVIIQNNSISMLGKGSSRVMVDGRIIELSGTDLINYLNSISAGDIKNIEVISNPPAKYEAGGDGGLININLKKGVKDSWKNTSTLSYDQNKYGFAGLRNSFLYNKNKLKFSANIGGSKGNQKVTESLDTYYPDGLRALSTEGKQKQDNVSGRASLDYDLSDHTTLGVQYLGNFIKPDRKDDTEIKIYDSSNALRSLLINTGINDLSTNNHSFNAHALSKLDTLNRRISFDVDYFTFNGKIDNQFIAKAYSPKMEFLAIDQSAKNVANQHINNISVKVDMEHPLKFMNLSYGAKASFSKSRGDIEYFDMITGTPELDPYRSNEFTYKENNQAVYISGAKDINSRWNIQLGLRVENTQTEGYSKTLNQTNTNSYLKLFPTFYLTYKKNDKHSFLFNYGRRINRPSFENLNPFRSYLNSKSYSEGNPFLQPSYNDNFDLTYIYKGVLRTNAFFNIVNNGFGVVFTSDPKTNTQIISRQNYFKEYYYGIGENYTADIARWWQSQNLIYLLGSKNIFTNQINAAPQNGVQVYLTTSNTFSLSKATKMQADYFFASSVKRGLYEVGTRSGLNLAIKQSMFKNNLQLSLLANDVFNTAYLKSYASVVNGIKQVYGQNNSSRYFRVSLTYNFGNDKINVKNRDFGNDDERKRTN